MSKKRNLLAGLICFLFAFVCLVSCVGVTLSPELAAKQQAETDAQEVLGKLVWDDEDRSAIVSSLIFTTQNKNYPGVTISWSSSEEDIIATNGKVNRPDSDDPRNQLVGEDLLATVIITATVVAEYSWEDNGTHTAQTEAIAKQFTFTVLAKPEGTDTGTIEDVKLRAWNYIYVEQGVDKALVSNSSITYNVLLSGVVTAKLNADGATKGFMLHDGTDGIYVYGDNTNVKIGDSVEVIGGVYSYYGSLQVGSNVSVSKSNEKFTVPAYKEVTPQAWEDQNKDLGDDVIGHLGGDLYKVEGYLTASYNATTKDEFCITDANTGEVSWIYYKSYNADMKAVLESYVGKYVKVTGAGYDRDSRVVKNHLLWDGGIEEAAAPVVDDQTKANVALSQITLLDAYDADFDLSDAGVWEIVSGTGIEIVDGVAKVTRAEEDQIVVLKVTVTVGEATASKEISVKVKKLIKENPVIEYITVEEAIALGSAQAHNTYTEEKYYIKGTVTGFYNETYGNFYITDGTNQICVYGLYSEDGSVRYDKMEVKPVDGDEIIVYGVLGQYNGNPQFKNAWFMGFVEESKYDTISIEEAIALGSAQAHNTYTEEKYYIEGTVTGLYNETYGNMYVTDGTNQICVYGLYSADGTVRYDKMEVKPVDGTKVVIYGVIGQYNGNPQFKNAWLMEIVGGEEPAPHEHKFVEGKCECGEVDPNYQAPEVNGAEMVFDFTTGTTTMESAYNAEEKEMTVNGIVFGYLQMKSSGYSGSNFLMFCKSTDAHIYNKTAFPSAIVKVEVFIPSGASGTAGYFLSLHKEAAAGNIVSTTSFVGKDASFSIEAAAEDGFYFFNLSSDSTTTKNGQLGKIVVTLADGSVVVPHEHKFVEGKCECGEKDPNYVAPEVPTVEKITIAEAIALGSAQEHNTYTADKYYIEGTVTGFYNTTYGNFYLTDGTNQICIYGLYSADGSVRYDKMEVKPVDGDTVVVYGIIGQYNGNPQFKNAWLIEHTAGTVAPHEHKFVDGKCECGEKDPNYEAPVSSDKLELTADILGLAAYADGSKTVGGVQFDFIELGSYGNGIQWRNKNGKTSTLWNAAALSKPIAKIELVYNAAQANYANANALKISFGTDSSVAGYETFLSTEKGGSLYTITPDAETYTFVKFTINITYSLYFDSITIYYAEEAQEETPAKVNKVDLDTLNGGTHSSSYSDYTSASGWSVTGCAINSGSKDSTSTANPSFGFLGGPEVRAVTLNGGTDKTLGTVKSGVLSGGLSKLSFNYTNLFTDTKFSVTVYIKDASGNVLKEEVVSYDNPNKVKYEVRTYELEFAVEGDFMIEIVNNRPNNLSGNKDRATIWNIEWVSAN